jgi:hypothetical protein
MLPNNFLKLALISIFFFTASIFAQTDTTLIDKGVNIFFYNGLGISYKYNANETFSYRVNVGLSTSLSDSENETDHYYFSSPTYSDTNYYSEDENVTHFATNLSYTILYNLIKEKSFNLYLGAGPSVNYSIQKYDVSQKREETNYLYNSNHTSTYSNYGIGVVGLVGIEAYLSKNVTLFAESQLSLYRSWGKEERESKYFHDNTLDHKYVDKVSSTNWQMDFALVKVGFGIYF